MHVFADGRTDLYGDDILGQYLKVARGGEGWRDVLASYDVQMLLIDYHLDTARALLRGQALALRLLG